MKMFLCGIPNGENEFGVRQWRELMTVFADSEEEALSYVEDYYEYKDEDEETGEVTTVRDSGSVIAGVIPIEKGIQANAYVQRHMDGKAYLIFWGRGVEEKIDWGKCRQVLPSMKEMEMRPKIYCKHCNKILCTYEINTTKDRCHTCDGKVRLKMWSDIK